MAGQRTSRTIRLNVGLETKEDPKEVGAQGLLAVENAVFTEGGGAQKRNGYEILASEDTDGAELDAGRSLATRDGELIRFTDTKAHTYLAGTKEWVEAGDLVPIDLSYTPVVDRASKQLDADMARNQGVTVYAWIDSDGGAYYSIQDSGTGRSLKSPSQIDAAATRVSVYAIGKQIHILWMDSANNLKIAKVAIADPTAGAGSPSTLYTDVTIGTNARFSVDSDGSRAVFAFWVNASNLIRVGFIAESGVVGGPTTGWPSPVTFAATNTTPSGPSVAFDRMGTGEILVSYVDNSTVGYQAYTNALVATHANSNISISSGIETVMAAWMPVDDASSLRRCIVYIGIDPGGGGGTVRTVYVNSAGSGLLANTLYSHIVSRPWADGEHLYHVMAYEGRNNTLWYHHVIYRDDGLLCGRFLGGRSSGGVTNFHPCSVTASGRSYELVVSYRNRIDVDDEDTIAVFTADSLMRVRLDFDAAGSHQFVEFGQGSYISSGGVLWMYDGHGFVEAVSGAAPDIQNGGTAGGGNVNGDVTYRAAYGWRNAQGEIEWGPTSPGLAFTGLTTNKVDITIFGFQHTRKIAPDRDNLVVGIFRTIASGSLYYLVTSQDPSDVVGDNRHRTNDLSSEPLTLTDDMSDAVLVTKEPLYTTGGILSNDGYDAGSVIATGQGRVFTTDAGDPDLVRYSQQRQNGFSLELADGLSIRIDPYGGEITAIATMDDNVIVFKERAIYHFSGPGPLANPDAGGGFSPPRLITSDVGCSGQRSVSVTPSGLVFQSAKGVYLLSRSMEVRYIGSAVEDFNSQVITAATLINDETQVRFVTSSGQTLLWDYYYDRWSTWSNHEGVGAIVVDGVYYYLRNDGSVWCESKGSYTDGNRRIMLGVETGWLTLLPRLQGLQKVHHMTALGDYRSSHTLNVYYQVDYENGWKSAPVVIDPGTFYEAGVYGSGVYGDGPYGGAASRRYQFRVHLNAKCQAIRFRFEDTETSPNYGAAYELTELTLDGVVLRDVVNTRSERMT